MHVNQWILLLVGSQPPSYMWKWNAHITRQWKELPWKQCQICDHIIRPSHSANKWTSVSSLLRLLVIITSANPVWLSQWLCKGQPFYMVFQSSAFSLCWSRKEGGVQGVASPLGRLGGLFSMRVHAEVWDGCGEEGICYQHLKRLT